MAADPSSPWRNPAEAAFKDEWRRLNQLAAALAQVRQDGDPHPESVAARQDRNLEMFEAMTARVGAGALTQMIAVLDKLETAMDGGAEAAKSVAQELKAAAEDMAETRDREMRALIGALGSGKPTARDTDEPVWEPFEG